MKKLTLLLFLVFSTFVSAQTATIKGIVKNEFKQAIEGVAVSAAGKGTVTDNRGNYILAVPANVEFTLKFSHITYQTFEKTFTIPNNKTHNYSPILQVKVEEMDEVLVQDTKKEAQGIVSINAANAIKIPGAKSGVETVLLTLPGVNNNNELSTQYNVRGGNFEENLVYVNGIEVYRPFLIRSGQQEGLSFVNENMVQNINFSAGGFQAKYGDKLSSVLDITYRNPTEFGTAISLSLLGGSATVEGTMFKNKLSALLGVRYRNNSLFINSKDVETDTQPNFTDAQLHLSYLLNPNFKIDFLGVFSLNNYKYKPSSRRTKFGTIADPQELIVYYQGQEHDAYQTTFGALSGAYKVNDYLNLSVTGSMYHTVEQEYFDILAQYNLGDVNSDFSSDDFGDVEYSEGIGGQLNHARNNLDALISVAEFKGNFKKEEHQVDFGVKYKNEDFRDQIKEWEVIDSVGFSVRPPIHIPNDQPYEPYTAPITPYQHIDAKNNVTINRVESYIQYSRKTYLNDHQIWYNFGIRSHYWAVSSADFETSNQMIFSARGQFAIKPDWEKDMLFRISGGIYSQPPFYNEMVNYLGEVIPTVEAQKSLQVVLGNDYSFNLWNRPFKLVSEAYYKDMTNVNIYSVDNVKVTYIANNDAVAYAAGIDFRLNGEFVPGTESWISLGFLKTEENYNDMGYIPRPTDQRFKFGMLFQDYVPNIPNIKMYLNLVYNTGVPGGSPAYTNPYDYQNRLNDYKRADIGVSYVFTDAKNAKTSGWLKDFKELTIGLEIFNVFDVQNSITNTWVRDVYSKEYYAIPNYMTPRVFNVKLDMKF